MTSVIDELEAILGVSAEDNPLVFALCLIPVLWIVKQFFSICYSFLTGKS